MKITDVKIRKIFNDESPLKAVASITLDDQLAIHDIKIIASRDKIFIVMPSKKNPDGTYRDTVHPINADFRALLEKEIIGAYEKALVEEETENQPL